MITNKAFDLTGLMSDTHGKKIQPKELSETGFSNCFDEVLSLQFIKPELSNDQYHSADMAGGDLPGITDRLNRVDENIRPDESINKNPDSDINSSNNTRKVEKPENNNFRNESEARIEDHGNDTRQVKENSGAGDNKKDVSGDHKIEDAEVEELVESLNELLNLLIDKNKKDGELQNIKTSLLKLR